jgi:hypothetical protein
MLPNFVIVFVLFLHVEGGTARLDASAQSHKAGFVFDSSNLKGAGSKELTPF